MKLRQLRRFTSRAFTLRLHLAPPSARSAPWPHPTSRALPGSPQSAASPGSSRRKNPPHLAPSSPPPRGSGALPPVLRRRPSHPLLSAPPSTSPSYPPSESSPPLCATIDVLPPRRHGPHPRLPCRSHRPCPRSTGARVPRPPPDLTDDVYHPLLLLSHTATPPLLQRGRFDLPGVIYLTARRPPMAVRSRTGAGAQ
jgi:hypothetical protein